MSSRFAQQLRSLKPSGVPLASKITALLGPTNTGKTHACIEQMLEHESGMLGLPLRLLAREVYDRVTARLGENQVALVTGEEKRIPKNAVYWICTVEAMPLEKEVQFLAVDEVQLIAHTSRGHVFTHRVMHARGTHETWFMGSDTALPILKRLIPTARFESRPRLSRLSFSGSSTLSRLPARSAVVAFSTPQVYALAERLRARKGGAAVVLGALSPRTRNAQVAMYQSGEVDYLVATDAIGMGLNLAVDHVAFAERRKFDGKETRDLSPAELGQIAGRAGRHLANGTFGSLAPGREFPESLSRSLTSHKFEPLRFGLWRNADLCFDSGEDLLSSLSERAPRPWLRQMHTAEDFQTLKALLARPQVARLSRSPERLRLLWAVCQIPDYRRLLAELHHELVASIFEQLCGPAGRLSEDWAKERIDRLSSIDGDLDTLMGRLTFIRTWTYVCHQRNWMADARSWQATTRSLEDQISDAVHAKLMQRFVESRRNSNRKTARSQVSKPRILLPETGWIDPASPFAKLQELQQRLAPAAAEAEDGEWSSRLASAEFSELGLLEDGRIQFDGLVAASLTRGRDILSPEIVLTDLELGAGQEQQVRRRLGAHVRDLVNELFGPVRVEAFEDAAARGLVYQLRQGLGTVETRTAAAQLRSLDSSLREKLAQCGVILGAKFLLLQDAYSEQKLRLRLALLRAHFELPRSEFLKDGPVSVRRAPAWSKKHLLVAGYAALGPWAVRCDILNETLAQGPLPISQRRLSQALEIPLRELTAVVGALGPQEVAPTRPRRKRRRKKKKTLE